MGSSSLTGLAALLVSGSQCRNHSMRVTTAAQKAMAAAAAMVTVTIPRGGSAGYLLGKVSLMTWEVGEAASQPAVGV